MLLLAYSTYRVRFSITVGAFAAYQLVREARVGLLSRRSPGFSCVVAAPMRLLQRLALQAAGWARVRSSVALWLWAVVLVLRWPLVGRRAPSPIAIRQVTRKAALQPPFFGLS
jgi:hypothetical protein